MKSKPLLGLILAIGLASGASAADLLFMAAPTYDSYLRNKP